MEIIVHSKNSVSLKFSKEVVPFQQAQVRIRMRRKMIQLDLRRQTLMKKSEFLCS